jgi:hypothetical protein
MQAVQNAQTTPVMQPMQFSQDARPAQTDHNMQAAPGLQSQDAQTVQTAQNTQDAHGTQNASQGTQQDDSTNVPTNEPPSETN